jgi:hypothetical protein
MKPAQAMPKSAPKRRRWPTLVVRLLVLLLVAGSLGLTSWSVNRLLQIQRQAKALSATFGRLTIEIEQMQSRWTPAEAERVLSRYGQVAAQLFGGQEGLATWIKDLKRQVVPLALDAQAEFGRAALQPASDQKVALIPATVSVQVKPAEGLDAADSPYQRLIRLTQYLAAGPKRADLVELEVFGSSNSVSRAVATLNLWAGEPGP